MDDGIEISYARGYVGDTGGQFDGVSSGQNLKDDRSARQLIEEAVRIAQSADYVIFIGGLNKSGHRD